MDVLGLCLTRIIFFTAFSWLLHVGKYPGQPLARISHELTTAAAYTSVLTALCSFGLLSPGLLALTDQCI